MTDSTPPISAPAQPTRLPAKLHIEFPDFLSSGAAPFATPADYDAALVRIDGFVGYMDSTIARLKQGTGPVLLTPAGCGPIINADFVRGMAQAKAPGEVAHLLRLLGPKGGTLSDATLAQMAAQMAQMREQMLPALREAAQTITQLLRASGAR